MIGATHLFLALLRLRSDLTLQSSHQSGQVVHLILVSAGFAATENKLQWTNHQFQTLDDLKMVHWQKVPCSVKASDDSELETNPKTPWWNILLFPWRIWLQQFTTKFWDQQFICQRFEFTGIVTRTRINSPTSRDTVALDATSYFNPIPSIFTR